MASADDTGKRVAFQGSRGAYSEQASTNFFGSDIALVPCQTFDDVFEKVTNSDVESGVVPIENSLTGPIYRNYDLLLKNDLWITGETRVRVLHNLIAFPGTAVDDIRRVYSHPQGLSQCERFIAAHPTMEPIAAYDTAGSVELIKKNGWRDAAAIASRNAADYYGMAIIVEGIEDFSENFTRFFALNRERVIPADADKTSIVYAMNNVPGVLFKSLSVFALRDIGLSKIESRPLHGKPWEYFFYLDLEDSIENERCKNALNHLQEITSFFKILGCYRQGMK